MQLQMFSGFEAAHDAMRSALEQDADSELRIGVEVALHALATLNCAASYLLHN